MSIKIEIRWTGCITPIKACRQIAKSGQILKYVLTDYYRKNSRKRSVPVELIDSRPCMMQKDILNLAETCNSSQNHLD